ARDALAAGAGISGELLRIRASCLIEEKKFAEAAAVLEKISEGKPEDAEAALQFAGALERSGERREAAAAYARFLGKFPNHSAGPGAALRLGFLEAGEGNREAALAAYRLAVRSPDLGVAEPARYQLALDLEDRAKLSEALKAYELLAVRNLAASKWRRAAAWRAAAMLERGGEWKRALAYYLRIERTGKAGVAEEKEARQAAARARRLEAYLQSVKRREEKMESREPLFR
ncbi:MAG: tetratricopeptide repeat protein, partial [bacterium]